MSKRPPIHTFKDLEEWQLAIQLAVRVRDIVRAIALPERYDFGQTRRAALSVSRNIAEGFGRDHLGDYLHHLSMSRASLFEVESDLHAMRALALDCELEAAIAATDRIGRMLTTHSRVLRTKLRSRSQRPTFSTADRSPVPAPRTQDLRPRTYDPGPTTQDPATIPFLDAARGRREPRACRVDRASRAARRPRSTASYRARR